MSHRRTQCWWGLPKVPRIFFIAHLSARDMGTAPGISIRVQSAPAASELEWRSASPFGLEEALSFSKFTSIWKHGLAPTRPLSRAPWRSVSLSSRCSLRETGAPERIRTSDPQIRSLVLYPAELRARLEGANLFRPPRKGKNYWRGWRTGRGGGGGGAAFSAKSFENSRFPPERWPLLPCPAPLRWLRLVGKGSGPS